ncbi:Inositol 2-dehydrogenase [Rubripirellula lacrimiformis]|uniref:Inositol 2-dehydrogenase n=1 Tax=Rubripirellula lacrimiformis TaxID=1930273 RepID=A0A517N8B4_9BACT|nr:Gfo/Idh/MocA family oxidoreductase [Rubripirellula lacrimiformis]QDT03379.1 Inositol 2-dehydrogenase [Rubripirellula lacrimiformis]
MPQPHDTRPSRRHFIQSTAAAAAAGAIMPSQQSSAQASDASSKIRIGFIGPGGRGFGAHVKKLCKHQVEGRPIELVAVCDVYNEHRDRAAKHIEKTTGTAPAKYEDYRDMIAKEDLDAVCIGTPDHWHAKQAKDSLDAGLHVYCEKPMTKTVAEAIDVMNTWKKSGKVMQVGVQSTSLPVWNQVNDLLTGGKLGKVLMYQTEYFRNSAQGQWRYYKLEPGMTPTNINWNMWLGVDEGLAADQPFDREVYRQWRRFWPFGSGMFTDLFVHRTTTMLKATGLRFPGRVVGAGGIYLEYDGRQVPDVATVVADFPEGVQGLVTATMACEETPIKQMIRGHFGSFEFGNGEQFDGFEFIPERSQVTRNSKLQREHIEVEKVGDTTYAHFGNWIDAMVADDPSMCNNDPELGAAAIATVILGAQSYREGKAYMIDPADLSVAEADSSWADRWEAHSKQRKPAKHIAGWKAGDTGSTLEEPDYMKLAGPWIDGKDPGA